LLNRTHLSDLILREMQLQFPKQIFGFGEPNAKIVWGRQRPVSLESGDLNPFRRAVRSRCLDPNRPLRHRHRHRPPPYVPGREVADGAATPN
jgi:hypothetical protein